MGIILYIGKNKEIIDNIYSIPSRNHKLAVLNLKYNYRHYIEEYMPDHILLSEEMEDFKIISEYISGKTNSNLIIIDSKKDRNVLSGVPAVKDSGTMDEVKKIIEAIDGLDGESQNENRDFRFLKQSIISFYSLQGGTGKTSLAFNTAWRLMKRNIGKILMIDLNFCEGPSDIPIVLNISNHQNIGNYINNVLMGDGNIKKSIIELSGIDILCPPLALYQSDKFDVDMLNGLIYSK